MSSKVVSIAQNAASLTAGKQYGGFSKVILHVTEDLAYTVGNDTGLPLELTMPFGTREMAQNILTDLTGYQYQAFDATDALIDPAVQMGDGLDVNGLYAGIYSMTSKMGKLYAADVGAPEIKEINQKFQYKSSHDRKVIRDFLSVYAKLSIQADLISAEVEERKSDVEKLNAALKVQAGEISAKVSKKGGNNSSFGWVLLDDSWTVYSNNSVVFRLMKGLAELTGKIVATSGKIGGFDILANYLSYNGQTWGGTNTTGGYFGINGLQLGKDFKVDMQGHLYAKSGTFDGTVRAKNVDYGGDAGYFSGSGIESHSVSGGRLEYNTVGTSYVSNGIISSLSHGDYAYDVAKGYQDFGSMIGSYMSAKSISLGGHSLGRKEIYYKDQNGNSKYLKVVTWD